jgi:hypothetical protein
MNVVDLIEAVGYAGNGYAARNQAERIEFDRSRRDGNVFTVKVGADLGGNRWSDTRLLGIDFSQQPAQNQSYKQPSGQSKGFFLKC